MSQKQMDRPRFFEGQYLGAADLKSVIDYCRIKDARHNLGAHTWGIATGLHLKEIPSPAGGDKVDVWITPGLAWDGFGRTIVVPEPKLLSPDKFKGYVYDDPDGCLVEVWLRYNESETLGPRPGFEVCDTEDQYSRVKESFRIEVGRRTTHLDRHDKIMVGGEEVDAQQVLQSLYPDEAEIFDESVPYQSFPEEYGKAKWLIPLGFVRWIPDPDPYKLGYFKALDEDTGERSLSCDLRQKIGVVAGTVQAVDGIIRMRKRTDNPTLSSTKPWSDDLVWVEGDLRVDEDLKLFGGKLDLRDDGGEQDGVPLLVQRSEQNILKGKDLQIVIGEQEEGKNRLVIGPLIGDAITEKLVVHDDAKVGIGIGVPKNSLDVNGGTVIGESYAGANEAPENGLLVQGNVGIGTAEPRNKLDVEGGAVIGSGYSGTSTAPDNGLLVQGKVGIGTTDPKGKLSIYDIAKPKHGTLTLFSETANFEYDGGDDGLFIFKDTGGKTAFLGGNVGIGTTNPDRQLHIKEAASNNTNGFRIENDDNTRNLRLWVGTNAANIDSFSGADLRLRTNNNVRLCIKNSNGNVGIGTTNPDRQLHIKESVSDNTNGFRIQNSDNTRNMRLWVGTGAANIDSFSGADLRLRTNNNVRLCIKNSNGNVGIGTTNPDSKLSIQGNGGALRLYSGQNNGQFWIGLYTDGGPGSGRAGWIGYGSDGTNALSIQNEKAGGRIILNPGSESIRDVTSSGVLDLYGEDINCNNDLWLNWISGNDVNVAGDLIVHGNKSGYVIDRCVNKSGDSIEQGDVVILGNAPAEIHYGVDDNIPVPEVDLTTKAYDHRICGVVAEILVEKAPSGQVREDLEEERSEKRTVGAHDGRVKPLQVFSYKELSKLDRKKILSGQIGKMVTLGCFAHCKVDADIAPIEVGDLLTSSSTKGHAQKVLEPNKAVGAIIGKALGPLKKGKGKIPVLVMMQ